MIFYISDCTDYGSNFQEFEGTRLSGHAIVNYADYSVEQCKDACVNAIVLHGSKCLSFNFDLMTNECQLNRGSASTSRVDMEPMSSFIYQSRDCI